MPLDPLIANPAKLELPNPLADSQMFLQNALAMRQIDESNRKRRRDGALQNVFSRLPQMVDGSGPDFNAAPQMLTEQGFGDEALEALTKLTNVGHVKAQTTKEGALAGKADAEAIGEKLRNKATFLAEHYKDLRLDSTPDEAKQAFERASQYGTEMGVFSPEGGTKFLNDSIAEMDTAIKNGHYSDFLRHRALGAKDSAEKIITQLHGETTNTLQATNKFGGGQSTTVASVKAPKPAGTTVNIDNRTLSKYAEKTAEDQAAADAALRAAADAAPSQIAMITRLRGLIPRAYTGMGAEHKLAARAAASGLAGMKDAEGTLQATSNLKMGLSKESLANISNMWQEGLRLGAVSNLEFTQLMASVPKITDPPEVIDAWLARAQDGLQKTMDKAAQRFPQMPAAARAIVPPPPGVQPAPPSPPAPVAVPTPVEVKTKAGRVVPPDAIDKIRANDTPARRAKFDEIFGEPGLAARVLGGAPNGGRPLPR